jgi:hypothetical protein
MTDATGPGIVFQGVIALEWPEPRPGHPGQPLPGWGTGVFDALSGKQILTVMKIEVHVPANGLVTADLTMYADEDGQPVYTGPPHVRGGEVIEGTFPFLVAEIRTRRADPPKAALAPKFLEPCAN